MLFAFGGGQRKRGVNGEDPRDGLGVGVEGVRGAGVEVQRAERRVRGVVQPHGEHAAHPPLAGGGGEAGPAVLGRQVRGVHRLVLADRRVARALIELVLQRVQGPGCYPVGARASIRERSTTKLMPTSSAPGTASTARR